MERWESTRRHGREMLTSTASATSYHRSFSSSLLDAIYLSIDVEGAGGTGGGRQREGINDTLAAVGKQHSRAMLEERKKSTTSSQKPALSRRGPATMNDLQPQQHHGRTQQQQQRQRDRLFANSTSSSSESSYGGFSSSDAEKTAAPLSTTPRPRPIRTSAPPEARKEKKLPKDSNKQKAEGSIGDRFRASKLYRDLKKAKAPASPGARLASFLNNLFAAAGSTRKAKDVAGGVSRVSGDASLCSSASSYSRCRLSRTPSSMGNAASGGSGDARRPVRFFPVSFVVDEDCRPRGPRWAYADQKQEYFRRGCPPEGTEVAEARRPTREATGEFIIRGYEEKNGASNIGLQGDKRDEGEAEGEEDDGAASYSSSDLFELENLAAIGAGGDLPVYETTRLEANRAIAQGPCVQNRGGEKRGGLFATSP